MLADQPTNKIERGFTLIELMVSLSIFAILSILAYGALKSVLDTRTQVNQHMDNLTRVQKTFSIMQRDLMQLSARSIRDGFGDPQPPLQVDNGEPDFLHFSRNGWRNPAGHNRSHLQRIDYRLEDGQLTRQSWRVLDRAQDSVPVVTFLIDRIQQITVRLLDQQDRWQNEWTVSPDEKMPKPLPKAIEITLDIEEMGQIRRVFPLVYFPLPWLPLP
jgi:general secretion pathway protein J